MKRKCSETDTGIDEHFLRHKQIPSPTTSVEAPQLPRPDEGLKDIYSELLVGQAFIEYSLEKFASAENLLAAVIQIDWPETASKRARGRFEAIAAVRKDLAAVIQIVCQNQGGCWGVLDYPIFAFVFENKDRRRDIQVVSRIKQQLAGLRSDTLTIGLAEHPCLDYEKNQIVENAYKALEHARFLGPDNLIVMDAVSLNVSGDQFFDKGDIAAAMQEFKRGLQLDPDNANLHNSLGVCHGVLKQHDRARRAFEAARTRDPDDVMVLYNLGLVHLLMDDRRPAMRYFQNASRLDADMYQPEYQMGCMCLDSGRFDQARQHLEKAARLNANTAVLHTCLGECYLALNQTNRAVQAFKKAVQLNGNDAGALSELGWLYHQMKKNTEIAELFCRQSVSIAPDNGLYLFRLGELLKSRGRAQEAQEVLKKASDLGYHGPETEAPRENAIGSVAKRSAL